MAANSKYHIAISSSLGEKGFLTKEYSPRQKPDSLFGSRFSTGDISYATMSRWQRFAQTNWMNGAFQKFLEDKSKFAQSNNIDVLTYGEMKLAKSLGTRLYNGAAPIKDGIYFNNAHYFIEGQFIKYTIDNFANVVTSKDFGTGKAPTDLEVYGGKLYCACGTFGLWSHATADHTTWAEVLDVAATIDCEYLKAWGDNLYITYTNIFKKYSGTAITLIKNFSPGGDTTYYPKKPEVYISKLYIPVNVAGSSAGGGQAYFYDGTTMDTIYDGADPIGSKMIVYEAKLLFVIYGLNKVSVKQFNGSSTTTMQSFDIKPGAVLFGSGVKYGSGAKYGAGSDKYLDPVDFNIWNNSLIVTMQRTSQQNTILIYDGYGWSEHISLPVGSNIAISTWIYDRNLFVGDSLGDIYQVGSTYPSSGYLQSSTWDAELQDIKKMFADVVVKHAPILAGDSIEIWYRTNGSGSFALLGSNATVGATTSTLVFPSGALSVVSTELEYKVILNSGDGTTTPIVKDIIVRYILAPDNNKRVFEYTIECTKKMKLLDGTFETRTPGQIINDMWALKQAGELLTLTDENADTHTVVFADTSPEVVTPFAGDDISEKYVYLRLFEL